MDKVLYKWFTPMCSKGKTIIWSTMIENAKILYDYINITDYYT
jgi:hypothetical protein